MNDLLVEVPALAPCADRTRASPIAACLLTSFSHCRAQVVPQPEHRDMMAAALRVEVLEPPSAAAPDQATVRLIFEPLKEIRSRVQLRATKATGGAVDI